MVNKEDLAELFNWVVSPIIEIKNVENLEKKLKEINAWISVLKFITKVTAT